ncbi:hypothetical protein CKA32_001959 [Geitlerinema sp. FC II]|nr:hypothetical protein CKA32_001959 [Geitlerinema sp. FC II]
MKTIAILPIPSPDGSPVYHAISGDKQSSGENANFLKYPVYKLFRKTLNG